jgi:hypothetical protein
MDVDRLIEEPLLAVLDGLEGCSGLPEPLRACPVGVPLPVVDMSGCQECPDILERRGDLREGQNVAAEDNGCNQAGARFPAQGRGAVGAADS